MANGETLPEREEAMIVEGEGLMKLLGRFVNGDERTEVQVESGLLPSLSKQTHDWNERFSNITAEADRAETASAIAIGAANQLGFASWLDLSSLSPTVHGQLAQVVGDTGEHIDPVTGESVANAGRYSGVLPQGLWRWLGPDVLVEKADVDDVAQIPGRIRRGLYGIREYRGGGENTPALVGKPGADGLLPVLLEVSPDGRLIGDFDLTQSLRSLLGGLNILEYRGNPENVALIVDSDRRVVLGYNSATGRLEGAFPPGSTAVDYYPNTWVGNAGENSADITFIDREFAGKLFELRLSTSNDLSSSYLKFQETVDDKGVCRFSMSGLEPDTRYYYGISPVGYIPSVTANFKTITASQSYRFCFASCAKTDSSSPVFEAIRSQEPEFFIHLGDLHYRDIVIPDEDLFIAGYSAALEGQKDLFAYIPTAYIYDDHDYGPNDADRTAPAREQCIAAYQRVVPHYPIPAFGKLWQSFSVGRVRYVIPDCRSLSDPLDWPDDENKRKLGLEQEQWLYNQLLDAKENRQFVCIAFSIPWIANTDPSSDKWGGYTTERARISDFIAANNLGGQCFTISGDIHLLAAYDASKGTSGDYSVSGGANMPSFNAAPMDQVTRPGWSAFPDGTYPHDMTSRNLFGQVDIEDEGGESITITYRGLELGASGGLSRKIISTQTLTLS